MKTLNIALAILGVAIEIMAIQDAAATDLLNRRHDEQYADPAGANVNWSGLYVGGRLGYGNANHDLTLQDYFKDYCDSGVYGPALANEAPILTTDGDDPDAFEDPNRFFLFGGNDLENCIPPVATANEQRSQYAPIGVVSGDSRDVANIDGVNSHGVIGGFQAGYDQQVYNWVLGVFGNYNFSGMETTATGDFSLIGADSLKIEKDDEWTVGIRAGRLLSERTMLYGLVGYTQADYDFTVSPDDGGLKNNVTFDGVTFGAGLEHAITQNVFLGIEGTHTIYGEETIFNSYDADLNTGAKVTDDLSETRIMGTLKIKLNGY